jgi:hypothetical protein
MQWSRKNTAFAPDHAGPDHLWEILQRQERSVARTVTSLSELFDESHRDFERWHHLNSSLLIAEFDSESLPAELNGLLFLTVKPVRICFPSVHLHADRSLYGAAIAPRM